MGGKDSWKFQRGKAINSNEWMIAPKKDCWLESEIVTILFTDHKLNFSVLSNYLRPPNTKTFVVAICLNVP